MNTKPNNKIQSPIGKQSEEKQAHTGKKPAMGVQSPADRSSSSLHGEKSSHIGKQAHTGSERSGGITSSSDKAKNLCDKTDKTCNKCNCTKTENYCFKCNKK